MFLNESPLFISPESPLLESSMQSQEVARAIEPWQKLLQVPRARQAELASQPCRMGLCRTASHAYNPGEKTCCVTSGQRG